MSSTEECSLVYIVTANVEESTKIASTLLDENLIACANIQTEVKSLYKWSGKLEETWESVAICKTKTSLVNAVVDRIGTLHSYECPGVIVLPITAGNPFFLKWIGTETKQPQ